MPGFEVQLDQLETAGGYVEDAAEKAKIAAHDLAPAEIAAAKPIDFFDAAGRLERGIVGTPRNAFGGRLGFDRIAWAYSRHLEAVHDNLNKLYGSAHATSEALDAVVRLYESADNTGKL
jgi:hypothetical protein